MGVEGTGPAWPDFMTSKIQLGCVLLGLTALVGCVPYPMGVPKEEWETLPPAQQAEYRATQARLDEQRRVREHEERMLRERLAAETARREAELLRSRREQARQGDVITVRVQGGMVAFYGKRHPYEPVAFDLVRGETRRVVFRRLGQPNSTTEIDMHFSEDGNTFIFDAPARKRFVVLRDGSWERGAHLRVPEMGSHDGHSEAIGVTLTIRFKDLPQRRPSQGRR